jgi:hypothetical protein
MMFFLLPLYYTTKCDPLLMGLDTCQSQANLTDFAKLTIANVPVFQFSPLLNGTTAIVVNETYSIILQPRPDPAATQRWTPGLTGRYVAPVLVMCIITFYTCCTYYDWRGVV